MEEIKKTSIEILGERFDLLYNDEDELVTAFLFLENIVKEVKNKFPSLTNSKIFFLSALKISSNFHTKQKIQNHSENDFMKKTEQRLNSIIEMLG